MLLTFCFFIWVRVTWVCSQCIFIDLDTYDVCTFYTYIRPKLFLEEKLNLHMHTHTKSEELPEACLGWWGWVRGGDSREARSEDGDVDRREKEEF